MSRFIVTVTNDTWDDPYAVIGYDPPLRTFYLQAFPRNIEGSSVPAIWLGTNMVEYPTLDSLVTKLSDLGFFIEHLGQHEILIMLTEAESPTEPSLAERLGLLH